MAAATTTTKKTYCTVPTVQYFLAVGRLCGCLQGIWYLSDVVWQPKNSSSCETTPNYPLWYWNVVVWQLIDTESWWVTSIYPIMYTIIVTLQPIEFASNSTSTNYPSCYMSVNSWQSPLFFSQATTPNQRKVAHVVRRAIECLCTHLVPPVHKGSIALRTT